MSITLRPYQNDGIHILRENFKKGLKRLLLVLATGGGKTIIFSEMCRRAAERGTQVLICTDRIELFEQTFKHLGNAALTPQRIDAGSKMFYCTAQISVGMVETVYNRIKRGAMKDFHPRLIVLDEAHKAAFFKIIEAFPDALVIGCTATPTHKDLYKYYEGMVANIDIPELIELGYLAKCRPFQMQDSFDDVSVVRGEFDDKQLFNHFNKKKLYTGVIDKWKEKCNGMKTLVFCCNIEHAIKTKDEFMEAGIAAEVVTSKSSPEERKRIVAAHEAGHFPVLVNCSVLTTGYDSPTLQAIVVNRATMSLSLWLQMVGRGARIAPGKKEFIVLDFGLNCTRHGLYDQAREWTLEPPKKKKKSGPAPIKNCPQCTAMLPASAMKCSFCGHKFDKKTHEEKNGVLVEIDTNIPAQCAGKLLSQMTVDDLIALQKVKKLSSGHIWRIVRKHGDPFLSEYAAQMNYSNGWIQNQLQRPLDECVYRDYVIK